MNQAPFPQYSMTMRGIVLITGMYTVAWGAFFKWFGDALTGWLAMNPGQDVGLGTNLYGSVGLIVGTLIFLSGFYPINWKWLTLIGIAGKAIMAIWFAVVFMDTLGWNKRTGFHLFFNELIWIVPLTLSFLKARRVESYMRKSDLY
ncbi:hypothetical protein KIH41_12515 [Litoribacter ruber]|uniref:hypothetical protein n=1 Tax=Litoribacter ruber TaxID=702568 RepID=UPI001BDAACEE|nr:hypothetical protein [Litoribacter ruber]MBT0812099.1 hypothetical protein [Litoribacter ruber]